jgi:hypothetical protein
MDKSGSDLFRFIKMKYYVLTSKSASKGESGESVGSQYDLRGACKNCGTGAGLLGALHSKGLRDVKSDLFYTLDGDLLISKNLYSNFLNEGVVLNQIVEVFENGEVQLPFYHIDPKISFPKRSQQSQGLKVESQCPICKQNGYFNDVVMGDLEKGIPTHVKPLEFHYEGIDENLLKQSDIFHTWEHMGLSNLKAEGNKVIRYARPLLIVSEKFKRVIESFKIKKIFFSEIILHLHAVELG